jgi:hypothetical protein
MAIYSKINGENVQVAGYEPFQLNDDTTIKDYSKAMSNGRIQDYINAILTGALKYGGVFTSYDDLTAVTPNSDELRILHSTLTDPVNDDGNYIYEHTLQIWQYAGQAIDLSNLEQLNNKQSDLTPDSTGSKYPNVTAVINALDSLDKKIEDAKTDYTEGLQDKENLISVEEAARIRGDGVLADSIAKLRFIGTYPEWTALSVEEKREYDEAFITGVIPVTAGAITGISPTNTEVQNYLNDKTYTGTAGTETIAKLTTTTATATGWFGKIVNAINGLISYTNGWVYAGSWSYLDFPLSNLGLTPWTSCVILVMVHSQNSLDCRGGMYVVSQADTGAFFLSTWNASAQASNPTVALAVPNLRITPASGLGNTSRVVIKRIHNGNV